MFELEESGNVRKNSTTLMTWNSLLRRVMEEIMINNFQRKLHRYEGNMACRALGMGFGNRAEYFPLQQAGMNLMGGMACICYNDYDCVDFQSAIKTVMTQ